jgi:hypothetical protein
MTIQLIKATYISGSLQAAASQHTLDAAVEADLVNIGAASYVGGAPDVTNRSPSFVRTDASGSISLVWAEGSAAFNDAGFYGASPSAAAAVNTTAIQDALDAGGIVTIRTPGVYLINATLNIGSNTNMILAEGVEIKASGAGVGNLLNSTVMATAKSSVTLSWTSGNITASVAWTAHGLTTADSVWLTGADQYQYIGVFQIISITDVDNFVVKLKRLPAASPTGTTLAVKAQSNTSIEGGIWNYNATGGNGSATGYLLHAIRLGGINNLSLSHVTGKDLSKYVLDIGAVTNLRINGGHGNGLNADYLKLRGPMFNAQVVGIETSGGDDILSIQNREPAAYESSNWTWGDCIGLKVDGLGGYTATGGIVLYPSVLGMIDGVVLNNFVGSMAANSIQIRLDNNGWTGQANIGSVTINNMVCYGKTAAVGLQGDLKVNSLIINNPSVNSTSNLGRFIYVAANNIAANIVVNGGYCTGTEGLLNTAHTTSTVSLTLNSLQVGTSWTAFAIGGSGTTKLRIRDLVMSANPGNLFFNVVGASSPTLYVDADRITNPSGAQTLTTSGTPTIYTQGPGWKVDLSLVSRLDGVIAYNTNAALGTLGVAGLVVGNGTSSGSWHLMSDPTKSY